jgi:hypothetical protein
MPFFRLPFPSSRSAGAAGGNSRRDPARFSDFRFSRFSRFLKFMAAVGYRPDDRPFKFAVAAATVALGCVLVGVTLALSGPSPAM